MKRLTLALLIMALTPQVVLAGKFSIDAEGDGGTVAYLEIDQHSSIVIAGCSINEQKYDFEIAVTISDPPSGSMLETMQQDAEASIKGSFCIGDFCKRLTFSRSDYFGGPSTRTTFDKNQVSSATGMEIDLPGGIDLKWDGQLREIMEKSCN